MADDVVGAGIGTGAAELSAAPVVLDASASYTDLMSADVSTAPSNVKAEDVATDDKSGDIGKTAKGSEVPTLPVADASAGEVAETLTAEQIAEYKRYAGLIEQAKTAGFADAAAVEAAIAAREAAERNEAQTAALQGEISTAQAAEVDALRERIQAQYDAGLISLEAANAQFNGEKGVIEARYTQAVAAQTQEAFAGNLRQTMAGLVAANPVLSEGDGFGEKFIGAFVEATGGQYAPDAVAGKLLAWHKAAVEKEVESRSAAIREKAVADYVAAEAAKVAPNTLGSGGGGAPPVHDGDPNAWRNQSYLDLLGYGRGL